MNKIDWYRHYLNKKSVVFDENRFQENLKTDEPYINLLKKYLKPNSKILECGCGLGRTVVSMSFHGFRATAIDNDPKMIHLAKMNAKYGKGIVFKKVDFFDIDKFFKKNSFDCCTHQGVLEHFIESDIKKILSKQLYVSHCIIFSVPIYTKFNSKYFHDNIYRNIWTKEKWMEIIKDFNVMETKEVRQRSDNLLVVIKR